MGKFFTVFLLLATVGATAPTMAVAPKTVPGASFSSPTEEEKDVLVLIEDENGEVYVTYISQREWENLQKEAIRPPKIKKMKKPKPSSK